MLEAWLSQTLADEEGPPAVRGKSVIIRGPKADVEAVAAFMSAVAAHLETADYCHMHLRDHMVGWSESKHVDIEITVDKTAD